MLVFGSPFFGHGAALEPHQKESKSPPGRSLGGPWPPVVKYGMIVGSILGSFWDRFQNISCLQNAHRACTRSQVSRAEGLKIHRLFYIIFGIVLSSFPNATF